MSKKTLLMALLMAGLCSAGVRADAPDAKVQKEVLAAMDAWKQAMIGRHRAALEALYAPDLSYTHSSGKQENKAEAIEAVVTGKNRIESIELADISIRIYGNTALVKSKTTLNMSSEGKASTIILDVLYVWVTISSRWQMAARQAIRLNP